MATLTLGEGDMAALIGKRDALLALAGAPGGTVT
jgi:hypothetical protein